MTVLGARVASASLPAVKSTVPATRTHAGEPGPAPVPRVAGLDGIRGLAALFVVMNHIFLRTWPGFPVDHAPLWTAGFIYGRFAVVVFIVLSGFSLGLAPARCYNTWLAGRPGRHELTGENTFLVLLKGRGVVAKPHRADGKLVKGWGGVRLRQSHTPEIKAAASR